jgi:predicted transcriptional regulator
MNTSFEENVLNSFKKVKEDINFLRQKLNKVEKFLLLKNREILSLKSEIGALNDLINNKKEFKQQISTGNERVINDHQQSSTMLNNAQQWSKREVLDENKPIRILIENKFRSLTDREFSVFMIIYQLEEELGKVTYKDIAMKLNLSEATVRNFITSLMNKGIPIDKERLFNKKTLFYVKKDFRDLNMASQLLELRQISKNTVDKTRE